MKTHALNNGTHLPPLGLGTWKSEPGEVYDAVRAAIAAGYRHIDCAAIYGNEAEVGRALADGMKAEGVPREGLWITSKLWNDAHRPEDVEAACRRTLQDLGLEYLDLYLMHWPIAHQPGKKMPRAAADLLSLEEVPLESTLDAMRDLEAKGMVRAVGVSNFGLRKLRQVTERTGRAPVVNQVELHPYLPQDELLKGCAELGVEVTAYSPLGSPDSASMFGRVDREPLLSNPAVQRVAERRGANVGQVLIAWALKRGTSVIPKSTNPERIRTNLEASELTLTEEDMTELAELSRGERLIDGAFFTLGKGYTVEDLWA